MCASVSVCVRVRVCERICVYVCERVCVCMFACERKRGREGEDRMRKKGGEEARVG